MTRSTEASVVALNRGPHDAEVICNRYEEHGEDEQRRPACNTCAAGQMDFAPFDVFVQRAALLVVAQIPNGVGCAQEADARGQENYQRAERVGIEEAIGQRDRALREHLPGKRES